MSEQVTGPRDPEENAEDRDLQKSEASVVDDAVDAGIEADGWHPDTDDAEDGLTRVPGDDFPGDADSLDLQEAALPASEADHPSGIREPGEEAAGSDDSLPVSEESGRSADAQEEKSGDALSDAHEMTFLGHLQELRMRLTRCLIAAFVGLLACYGFSEQLFQKLMEPLVTLLEPAGGSLIYTGLPEAFFTHLKVAAVAGLFAASPYIFYQLWMFVAPGLYEGERKWIVPIAVCSAACFVTGALFGYYVVFPFGFQFFLGYATDFIRPMPSVKEYFSFATGMLFAFGLIFELPLFMLFLASLGIVTSKGLRKYRKYAMLGSFVVAAILTPPDVVSQILMAGPLCLLYEVGIWVAWIFGKKPKEPAKGPDMEKNTVV